MARSVKRLYRELKPSHYELRLNLDATKLRFQGSVTIKLRKTGRPSQRLTFHQVGLKIDSARVVKSDRSGQHELQVRRINNQDTLNEVRLHTSEMVYSGEYEIGLTFHGTISRAMTGVYPCFFMHEGQEHTLLATQFESHHAREVFPCIDEPEAKATFALTLVTDSNLTVLANTPSNGAMPLTEGGRQLLETSFATTPKMSTYLLAFIVGELQNASTQTKHGTTVTTWATITQPKAALDFGLDVAKRSIEFFEDYFGVPYPLPKIDHAALPDFTSGAMENWGLITYRERLFLAYPGETSQSVKETIATIIAHETSHQWFGNLVTMRWWDDLWLNESFANLMEYQAVDALFPEWHIWEQFIVNEGLSALRRDATVGVQAVKTPVRQPDEISSVFDPSIVYAKGGRLLYMLKTYIGEATFRDGLKRYFTKHAYGNTPGDDLWQALQAASDLDVAAFMKPWLERPGLPVLSVDQTGKWVSLRQAHFLENGEVADNLMWPIPLLSAVPKLPRLLAKAGYKLRLTTETPIYLNQGAAGHYLVNYVQTSHRQYLIDRVRQLRLGVSDRLMLLASSNMLAKAGYQPFRTTLELLDAYQAEPTEAVWSIVALTVAEARRFIDLDEGLEPAVKSFIRQLIRQQYQRLGWDERTSESPAEIKLRALVISLGGYAEEPTITKTALQRFERYQTNAGSLPAELRSVVFGLAVRAKTDGALNFLLQLHDETTNSDLKADIMAAATLTQDRNEAMRLLARLQDPRLVKPQDADHWLIYLLRNRCSREQAWQWLVDHWAWIEQTYAHDMSYDNFPRYAATVCNTRTWVKKYQDFFAPKQNQVALKRNITIGLSEIDTRVAWLERDLASVQAFFKHPNTV